jgi:putative LysE/RhtB family amino acid efflux pump
MSAFAMGLGLGGFVAAQLGPISLLLIRSVLRGRLATGLAIGAGAALIDVAYAGLGVAGAAPLLTVGPLRLLLGLAGATVLLVLGARTLRDAFRIRLGGEADSEVATPRRAFATSLAATASNPLTIVSWAAIFAAASTAAVASSAGGAAALLLGIGLGSAGWFCLLTMGVWLAGRRIGPRTLRTVDVAAGAGLVAFGGLLGWRAAHQE